MSGVDEFSLSISENLDARLPQGFEDSSFENSELFEGVSLKWAEPEKTRFEIMKILKKLKLPINFSKLFQVRFG